MRFYKRMIRPMVDPPALQGMNCSPSPLLTEDYWVDDTFEESEKKEWEKLIKDPMSKLCVDEKYVEVELPKPEVINVKPDDVVCLTFDVNEIDIETACKYSEKYAEILPEETGLLILPNILSLEYIEDMRYIDNIIHTAKKRKRELMNNIWEQRYKTRCKHYLSLVEFILEIMLWNDLGSCRIMYFKNDCDSLGENLTIHRIIQLCKDYDITHFGTRIPKMICEACTRNIEPYFCNECCKDYYEWYQEHCDK